MELLESLAIIRRYWLLIIGVGIVAGLTSLAAGLLQPAHYATTARLLVHSSDLHPVDIEDALAYDLAAIVKGQAFDQDVADRLKQQGLQLAPAALKAALSATNLKREVWLTAEASTPAEAEAILQAALVQLPAGGLRYWGSAQPNNNQSLVVEVLDPATPAIRTNGLSALLRLVLLRIMAGLAVGCMIAFLWYFVEEAHRPGTISAN